MQAAGDLQRQVWRWPPHCLQCFRPRSLGLNWNSKHQRPNPQRLICTSAAVEQAAVDAAVLTGLRYLASIQAADGRFGNGIVLLPLPAWPFYRAAYAKPWSLSWRLPQCLEAIIETKIQ